MGKRVIILHDAVGPAHNVYTKGDVVPEEMMGHSISDNGKPLWYKWDLDRLVRLGAVAYTDAPATKVEGEQYGPTPDVPEGRKAPAGGETPPAIVDGVASEATDPALTSGKAK